jgi:hypothetical protein
MSTAGSGASSASPAVVQRFAEACARDDRIVAAFLGGSLAAGTADAHSDLDLYAVARADSCAEIVAAGREWVAAWGDPVFVDVTRDFFGLGFDMLHFVLENGVNGEVAIGHPGNLQRLHGGPHRVLVDKTGVLAGVEFPLLSPSPEARQAATGRALAWFWLHVIGLAKALARDRHWVAHQKLDELRRCVWRLLGAAELSESEGRVHERALAASLVGLDRDELLTAADGLIRSYRALAPRVAERCGVTIPEALGHVAERKLRESR